MGPSHQSRAVSTPAVCNTVTPSGPPAYQPVHDGTLMCSCTSRRHACLLLSQGKGGLPSLAGLRRGRHPVCGAFASTSHGTCQPATLTPHCDGVRRPQAVTNTCMPCRMRPLQMGQLQVPGPACSTGVGCSAPLLAPLPGQDSPQNQRPWQGRNSQCCCFWPPHKWGYANNACPLLVMTGTRQ